MSPLAPIRALISIYMYSVLVFERLYSTPSVSWIRPSGQHFVVVIAVRKSIQRIEYKKQELSADHYPVMFLQELRQRQVLELLAQNRLDCRRGAATHEWTLLLSCPE